MIKKATQLFGLLAISLFAALPVSAAIDFNEETSIDSEFNQDRSRHCHRHRIERTSNQLTIVFDAGTQPSVTSGTFTGFVALPDQSIRTVTGTTNGAPGVIVINPPSLQGSYILGFYVSDTVGTYTNPPSVSVTSSGGINAFMPLVPPTTDNLEDIRAYVNLP